MISLLRQLYPGDQEASRDETFYWRLVLRYCVEGNLQAALDETWHLLWEQHDWTQEQPRVGYGGNVCARARGSRASVTLAGACEVFSSEWRRGR